MRMIDLQCPTCGHIVIDHFQRNSSELLPLCHVFTPVRTEASGKGGDIHCAPCLSPMRRAWLPSTLGAVIADSIPGGLDIKNALCNPDGSPRRYYSKTEIAREAAKRGYTNMVQHQGTKGGDTSKITTRWV